ncbi:MAG: type VI secretion system membrane subunit TssM [Dyella sp.]
MNYLVSVLNPGTLARMLGLLLLAVMVWLGGPYLGLGEAQPLASVPARLLLIALIVVAWLVWLQFKAWRGRYRAGQLSGELSGQERRLPGDERDQRRADERGQLQARFQEAIDALRKSRRGAASLDALPWYVVIGPPGSGKSTLLQNSGLSFPLAERFGNQALRGIGGTRDCDWWFTDQAIFLDTAGRYTTQDSDSAVDASAWQDFLRLLRRYRRRQPLNGVIVSLSMAELMSLDENARQAHVRALRGRLDELGEQLRISVPVYLVLTKCDLIAGFSEYFDNLDPTSRSQVWGMSFPLDSTLDGSAAGQFSAEFGLLQERLHAGVVERLQGERERRRRAAVLAFPQQWGALGGALQSLVEDVFTPNSYQAPALLRGVYFTSGTQEGAPIDRMLGAVARTFGVDAARLPPSAAPRRTFFVERLLKEVVLRESGLAGTRPALERQKMILQLACYTAVMSIAILLCLGFAGSYARNKAYVGQVQSILAHYPAADQLNQATTAQAYFTGVLQRLEVLASAQASVDRYQQHVPLLMRFGLYQGRALDEQVQAAYLRELNALLLPGLAAQLHDGVSRNAANPQALYGYLKGYLMLGEPAHRDNGELRALASGEWQRIFPQQPVLQGALDRHLQALLSASTPLRALPLDQALIAQARATLATADPATLIYAGLQLDAGQTGAAPLQIDQHLGLLGNVFRRKSGVPLTQPMPALFTQPVFAAQANGGIDQAVARFAQDSWVVGGGALDASARAKLHEQVLDLYQRDYINAWDGLLNDLQLQPVGNIQDASAIAAKLAGPSSPLKALLALVRDNTADLLRAPVNTATGKSDTSHDAVAQALAAPTLTSSASATPPGQAISTHFAALDALTQGPPGATPLAHTMSLLDQLSKSLLSMTDFSDPSAASNPALLAARQDAAQLPPPVGGWLAALSGKSQALVTSGSNDALIEQFKQAEGSDCAAFTQGRFPFDPSSSNEIPLQNFAELFGNGGRLDQFYQQTLSKQIDSSGKVWRWKSDGPASVLAQAQIADSIRQRYFRSGSQPQVGFSLQAMPLGAGISKLSVVVDGQTFTSSADATASTAAAPASATTNITTTTAMNWPGPQPGHVVITALDAAGKPLKTLDYQGEWAWFRALQAAHLTRRSDLQFVASFSFGAQQASVLIQASSLNNPFLDTTVQRFRCGS